MIRYCPRCWAEVDWDATACAICGALLGDQGEDFVDKLIAALRHPEPTRAGLAIYILGERLREPRAVVPLIALLDQAHDPYVFKSGVEASGQLGDDRAVPVLRRLLHDSTCYLVVRVAAAQALARIGGQAATEALNTVPAEALGPVEGVVQQALKDLEERPTRQE
jgi:hypothetical protein